MRALLLMLHQAGPVWCRHRDTNHKLHRSISAVTGADVTPLIGCCHLTVKWHTIPVSPIKDFIEDSSPGHWDTFTVPQSDHMRQLQINYSHFFLLTEQCQSDWWPWPSIEIWYWIQGIKLEQLKQAYSLYFSNIFIEFRPDWILKTPQSYCNLTEKLYCTGYVWDFLWVLIELIFCPYIWSWPWRLCYRYVMHFSELKVKRTIKISTFLLFISITFPLFWYNKNHRILCASNNSNIQK